MAKGQDQIAHEEAKLSGCLKSAQADPKGYDPDPAWDYVAAQTCPPTRPGESPRETLAKHLLDGLSGEASLSEIATAARMAKSLMGMVWVNLYTKGRV